MNILITGSNGFIGKNLTVRLQELTQFDIISFNRQDSINDLSNMIKEADVLVHLAGENRPVNKDDFQKGNYLLTKQICNLIKDNQKEIPIIMASSSQAALDNLYGKSKLASEVAVEELSQENGNPAIIYRLPGVFGKWCKPNYNSVVATFCHNIANDLPIEINDPDYLLSLVYIDDVIDFFINNLTIPFSKGITRETISPEYTTSLGDLAKRIYQFKESRTSLISERVGDGFLRALYSTYVSYLPKDSFQYPLLSHTDKRGSFVEMLKTKDSGQFSFFTAHSGITRGGHYHHSKTEKFLVLRGKASFKFRNIINNEIFEIITSEENPTVVETIPGWAHNITNIGNDEMIVMLWANEIFDPSKPDTISSGV